MLTRLSWLLQSLHMAHWLVQLLSRGSNHITMLSCAGVQFIIDYYTRLPKTIAFVHGHRYVPASEQPGPRG